MYQTWTDSIKFYNEALDLHEVRRKTTDDFIIVYLSNDVSDLSWNLPGLKIIHSHIIWVNANSTWHSRQRITRQRIRSMKRWDAFVSKMKQWESISL